ncbi:MAG TPA: methyltransferase domain-containing protein [Gemmatimonadales bacterium]|nr:methyltransferase domain-containing protein [Gemmatimonadales bacterium]
MTDLAIRRIGFELLDDPAAGAAKVEATLTDIARANRWFGGLAALRYGLRRTLGNLPAGAAVSLLDIGTGLGDAPGAAVRWGAARGIRIAPVGLERNRIAARLARARGLPLVVGCAGRPPIAEKSVDVVLVSQVAHHFEPDSVVQLFRTCDRLARLGVIVADLRRAALGAAAFWVGSRALRFDPVTRADGITSIRRGFTVTELARLLERAGVRGRVARRPGYRLVATWAPA